MVRRKSLFLKALQENKVSILPRLAEAIRNTKCPYCKFYQKCMNEATSPKHQHWGAYLEIAHRKGVSNC